MYSMEIKLKIKSKQNKKHDNVATSLAVAIVHEKKNKDFRI